MNTIKHALAYIALVFLTLITSFSLSLNAAQAQEDFLPPDKAFALQATTPTPDQLQLHFSIAPRYYMYKDHVKFRVVGDDEQERFKQALLEEPIFGEPIITYDETFDQELPVFYDPMVIQVPLKQTGQQQTIRLIVTAQGCADAGLCYPPEDYPVDLEPVGNGYQIAAKAGLFERMLGGSKQSAEVAPLDFAALALVASGADDSVNATSTTNTTTPSSAATSTERSLSTADDTQLADWLNESNFFKIILITFGLGLLLSLTPCVLPMLPILLALVVGQQNSPKSSDSEESAAPRRFRGLGLTLVYVLGTSVVYTLLGVAAASIGAALAIWIQNPWVLSIFAIVLVILAFAMFGSFSLQTPTGVQTRLNQLMDKLPGGRYGSAFIMGMVSALIAGPCVAAPLAGVLLFISQTGDMLTGAVALFALAWGQGVSLIVIGTTSGALMPKAGSWMEGVKQFCGLLLLAVALWMVQPLLPNWLAILLWAFLALCLSIVFGAFKATDAQSSGIFSIFAKAIAYIALIWAVLLLIGLATGRPSLLKPLQGLSVNQISTTTNFNSKAGGVVGAGPIRNEDFRRISSLAELEQILSENQGQVTMLDFYADWCVACHQMEAFTFNEPEVYQLMHQMNLLQVDVTPNTAEDRELLKRFRLFGPPGIIFFDEEGQELNTRVVGFQNAERFATSLKQVLGQ